MRYQIVKIINKKEKINIRCWDSQEQILLKVSLNSNTLECTDKSIPDSLQRFVESNQESINIRVVSGK